LLLDSDPLNEYVPKMVAADGILLGSPTYFADITTNMKALIERAGMVTRVNGDLLQRKVGAGVVAVRRGGAIHAFDSLLHFFTIGQMIVVGSSYWNIGIGESRARSRRMRKVSRSCGHWVRTWPGCSGSCIPSPQCSRMRFANTAGLIETLVAGRPGRIRRRWRLPTPHPS